MKSTQNNNNNGYNNVNLSSFIVGPASTTNGKNAFGFNANTEKNFYQNNEM
jgi:hypothetical protein